MLGHIESKDLYFEDDEEDEFENLEKAKLKQKIDDQQDKIKYLEESVEELRKDKRSLKERNEELRERMGEMLESRSKNLTMFSLVGAASCGLLGLYGVYVMNITYILFGIGLSATFLTGYKNVREEEGNS